VHLVSDDLRRVPEISDRRYEDLVLGQRFGPFAELVPRADVDRLRGPVGDPRAGAGAPLGVLPLITLRTLRRTLGGIIPGGVLISQRFTVHAELPAEVELQVYVAVSARERRGERLDTTFTFACHHDQRLAAVVQWTIMAPPAADPESPP
jgi:hypothetical protein